MIANSTNNGGNSAAAKKFMGGIRGMITSLICRRIQPAQVRRQKKAPLR
jgi:hypothetical protein